ncbi:isocitrate lyase/phosphoenolpyruvate mutase family protein [Mucilaginibacter sp. cycad4]|uniref:isocitrate lyase/PEP mutase family protein n=1 Tax=Mucilaginibacter sp. cycad4 TaxID=3342096 RepID=UPI002AAB834C|nr:isocitrate lyase/phosphoenolpyruvate mutase family protein [Mucilaginibacter gossypii]WPV02117.1 isocitrate lyase/phosphoenolpyruvate mutase family protein [Mucilaginibacter gossypii]
MCFNNFKQLHQQDSPLFIGNIWDAHSARLAEQAGFQAVGTSSAAISRILGYQDGEEMTFEELFFMAKHIIKAVTIPVSIDMEAGYCSDMEELNANLERLVKIGISGINIEDSVVLGGIRYQVPIEPFASTLKSIRTFLDKKGYNLFVNARTDAFLLGNPEALNVTLERISAFETAGADGIFIPGIAKEEDITIAVNHTSLPINTYILPGVPSYDRQQELGVKRISSGGAAQAAVYNSLETILNDLAQLWDFAVLFK